MEILSVYDSAFKPYGRVVEGYPTEGLVKALATTPCTDGVVYLPVSYTHLTLPTNSLV